MLNIGKGHWRYCERHRTKWLVGHSLFSDWLKETPTIWLNNSRSLAEFREVKPLDWQWTERLQASGDGVDLGETLDG